MPHFFSELETCVSLLLSTILLRPYVFAFLGIYLLLAWRDLGPARTVALTLLGWGVAFLAEYASTRIGIPFGYYSYIEATRGQEIWISNVPLMDSLSFVFLFYASSSLIRWTRGTHSVSGPLTVFFFVLLDVMIDPVALRGERWFLGQIFTYPEPGIYFGVPLTNFVGWAIVGTAILLLTRGVDRLLTALGVVPPPPPPHGLLVLGGALYYLVVGFNLAVTVEIGEGLLAAVGLTLHVLAAALLLRRPGLGLVRIPSVREERVH